MPFTALHFGAGAVFKGALHARFSFVVFAGSQILIDLEPLVRIVLGQIRVHGISHTFLGAAVIGIVATLAGKPLGEWALRLAYAKHHSITWLASALGAFSGTFSHIVLDGIMHVDVQPWFPFPGNPFIDLISLEALHTMLIAAGILGGVVVVLRSRSRSGA